MADHFEQPEEIASLNPAQSSSNELSKCAQDMQPNPMEQMRQHVQQSYNGLGDQEKPLLKSWLNARSNDDENNLWHSNAEKAGWIYSKELRSIEAEVSSPTLAKQWLAVINELKTPHS